MAADSADAFTGANCPLITPFDETGVDTDALAGLVDSLLARGLDGLVPCGTSGEFASLSDVEHREAIEATVEAAEGRAPVLAGAAATTVEGALSRLAAAAEAGATAGLVTLPYFHGANEPAGDERFLRAVAADTPLPLYLYNLPNYVGREIPLPVVERVAEEHSVIGCKDTSGDFEYFLGLDRHTPDDFALLQGYDSLFVPSLLADADGGINALTNAVPEPFANAIAAVRAGDYDRAREIQATEITPLFELCARHGFAPASKTAATARGFVPDTATTVRPPLVTLDDGATTAIERAVGAINTDDPDH
jgi:4-hydroxy-tetrahydrodipicolinate synthase